MSDATAAARIQFAFTVMVHWFAVLAFVLAYLLPSQPHPERGLTISTPRRPHSRRPRA